MDKKNRNFIGGVLRIVTICCVCMVVFFGCRRETQQYAPIREEMLSDTQQYFVSLTENFDLALIEVSEEITEEEKHRFFCWYISQSVYAEQLEIWKKDDAYHIPREEIERIVFTHLDTDTIDTEQEEVWSHYDSAAQEYVTKNIGGYGGARWNEVIIYSIEGDLHHVALGTFDSENESELIGRYDVVFEVSGVAEDYRVLAAKNTAVTKDPDKRRAYLG